MVLALQRVTPDMETTSSSMELGAKHMEVRRKRISCVTSTHWSGVPKHFSCY